MTFERGLLTVEEAARYLALGRSMTYRLIQEGSLPSIKINRCRRVPVSALEQWIEERMSGRVEDGSDD